MGSRKFFAASLMACLLTVGCPHNAQAAVAAPVWQVLAKPSETAKSNATEIKQRRRGKRGKPLYLPIVPYSAYDYPYYYRRGFYPTHIGPGYIYYGHPYFYRRKYSDRCSYHRHRRCVAGQKGACRCR
jgi:hypothetical protein